MKKVISLVILAVMVMSVAACGNNAKDNNNEDKSNVQTETPKEAEETKEPVETKEPEAATDLDNGKINTYDDCVSTFKTSGYLASIDEDGTNTYFWVDSNKGYLQ